MTASVPHRPPAETDEMEKAKLEQVRERTKAYRQGRRAAEEKLVSREETHEELCGCSTASRAG